ncbi:thioredoxin domain-containing protein, partial [Nocardia higoensis]|uniref:thioredoxin domain-containing protein n=1 Tax=Nocardia higoensis TaxID=228599 RepID=UPI0005926496
AELVGELGPIDGAWAGEILGVTTGGNFEQGTSVPTRYTDPDDPQRFERIRDVLSAARQRRPQPARDDKVVTAWNGMAITALAEGGAALGEPGWIDAAITCARFLLAEHVHEGRLRRASLGGKAGASPGVLEDYAWLATALLALYQVTARAEWLDQAQRILDSALRHFADPESPGNWYDTADDAETLVARPRDPIDGATPAGASSLAEALLTASALAEPARATVYREAVEQTLRRGALVLARAPRSAGQWLAVAEAALRGPIQVAVATPADRPEDGQPLLAAARSAAPGGAVIIAGPADSAPLLADRGPVGSAAAAYVCRGSVCDLPVTGAAELHKSLAG